MSNKHSDTMFGIKQLGTQEVCRCPKCNHVEQINPADTCDTKLCPFHMIPLRRAKV